MYKVSEAILYISYNEFGYEKMDSAESVVPKIILTQYNCISLRGFGGVFRIEKII